jgi:hypothetical protein
MEREEAEGNLVDKLIKAALEAEEVLMTCSILASQTFKYLVSTKKSRRGLSMLQEWNKRKQKSWNL